MSYRPPLTPARVRLALEAAGALYDIPPRSLLSRARSARVARARAACLAALHQATDASLSALGRAFDRDHTTIRHHIQTATARAMDDPSYALDIVQIAGEVTA